MSKSTIAGILVIAALLIGITAFVSMRDSDDAIEQQRTAMPSPTAVPTMAQATPTVVMAAPTASATPTVATTPTPAPTPTKASGFSMAEVATHNTRENCWAAVNGNVYDLSAWIAQHPGGPAAIAKLCGTDGSAQFNKQHGG